MTLQSLAWVSGVIQAGVVFVLGISFFRNKNTKSKGTSSNKNFYVNEQIIPDPRNPNEPNPTQHRSIGVERAELVQQAIYQISEAAISTDNLDDLFQSVHSILSQLIPAEDFYISLYDSETGILSFPYFKDRFDPPPAPRKKGRGGITEYVLKTGEPLFASPQVFADLVSQGEIESMGSPSIDWVGVPLKVHNQTIGVMVVQTYKEGIRYTKEELEILKFISSQVALAIERKRVERTLRESEERFRTLFENAPVGIYRTTLDGRILMANPILVKMLGFSSLEALLARNVYQTGYVHPEDRNRFLQCLEKEGVIKGMESTWVKSDNSIIHVRENASKVLIGDGNEFFIEGTVEDISDQKIAQAAIQISEERYRNLFESTPISLWEADLSITTNLLKVLHQERIPGFHPFLDHHPEFVIKTLHSIHILEINRATLKFFQAEQKDDLFFGLERIFCEDSYKLWKEVLGAIWEGATDFTGEGYVSDLKGKRMAVQLHLSVALGGEGPYSRVILSLIDVTARKHAEDNLLRRANELSILYSLAVSSGEATREDELIERTTQVIGETLYPDQYGILLLNSTRDTLVAHASYRGLDPDKKEWVLPVGRGILGRAAASGKAIIVSDVLEEQDDNRPFSTNTRAEICVPMKVGERVIGMINVESSTVNAFTVDDGNLIEILAGQLSVAIDRLRTEQHERQQAEQLAIIYDVSQEILGASLELEKVYIAIHQAIGRLMPSEAFVITLVDSQTDEIVVVYQVDRNERLPLQRIPMGRGLSGYIISTGKSLLIDDLIQPPQEYSGINFGEQSRMRSILAVPIRLGEQIMGVLSAQSSQSRAYQSTHIHLLELLTSYMAIALRNARLYQETLQRADELSVLVKVSSAMRIAKTQAEMYPIILNQVCDLLKVDSACLLLRNAGDGEYQVELACGAWEQISGKRLSTDSEIIQQMVHGHPALNYDILADQAAITFAAKMKTDHRLIAVPLSSQQKMIGALWAGRLADFDQDDLRLINTIADIAANAIHRSSLHEQSQRLAQQMATVSAVGRSLAESLDLNAIYDKLTDGVSSLLPGVTAVLISFYDPQQETLKYQYILLGKKKLALNLQNQNCASTVKGDNLLQVIQAYQPVIDHHWKAQIGREEFNDLLEGQEEEFRSAMYVPLLVKGEFLGIIQVLSDLPEFFTGSDAELLNLLANTAAVSIENARLFRETEQRLRRLAALRAMDMAISSSFDLKVTLSVLLDQIIAQLGVDAVDVLLYNPASQALEYVAGRGFRNEHIAHTRLRLNEDLPGKVVMERRIVSITTEQQDLLRSPRLASENFVSYFGVPLMTKGQLKGVLETFLRAPLSPDLEWLDFLEAMAGDTAIAVDNATLFNELQRSNIELTLAYDTTLEGWSRIMEMRELETEGHTQSLVETTIKLARAVGMPESDIIHLRRGVLLHDVGKMGIPDSILHKAGSLTEEEWEVMRLHPAYAYEMLSAITYLRPALDIPFCHHEKWDGTGYPRGLRGNRIPLAARVFAVVDTWDAMRSDRPYRKAFPDEEVIEYLQDSSETHFDPHIVEVFLRIISE